jgi:hypothetical protein
MQRQFIELAVDDLVVKDTAREGLGDIERLTKSVEQLGLLCPVIVDRDNVLIDGARRLEACRRAGVARLPCVKVDIAGDSMTALQIQVDATLCTEPLSESALDNLIEKKKHRLSRETGKSGPDIVSGLKRLFTKPQKQGEDSDGN